jgi:hypothetical protein
LLAFGLFVGPLLLTPLLVFFVLTLLLDALLALSILGFDFARLALSVFDDGDDCFLKLGS